MATRPDGRKARAELAKMDLRPVYQDEINSCLAVCDYFKTQIKQYDEEVERKAVLDDDCKLLMTIPGISFFGALLITSELGDWKRFPSSRKLASYAGLVPSTYASGGRTRHGSITKQGSKNLRFILLQAITHLARRDSRFGRMYTRIKIKHGAKTARIAVSRKLLCVIFAMLKSRQSFQITKDRQHVKTAQSSDVTS
jgi:transposase